MKKELLKVSVRQKALFIADAYRVGSETSALKQSTALLAAQAAQLGFAFSEALLQALNQLSNTSQLAVREVLQDVSGVRKNWTPLVKGWDVPTGESVVDHVITWFANSIGSKQGTRLACGHLIPAHTFPLERYNGCPFCGTPFVFAELKNYGQGSKLSVLELWTAQDMQGFLRDLLQSKTALDASQVDSLKTLLQYYALPADMAVGMKETLMLVIDTLVEADKEEQCAPLFKSPNDILRYLWYKHTGMLQVIRPKTLVRRTSKSHAHLYRPADRQAAVKVKAIADLKLKYNRQACRRVALWLNSLDMEAEKACELMHPKREMWVRFIRALRLAEYSKRTGFERLSRLMDVFYQQSYEVWQAKVNHFRLKADAENTFDLLKQRPGLFARSLFSNMLWFGEDITLQYFSEVVEQLPARLVFSLNMYAKMYFQKNGHRAVKPLGGENKRIATHPLLALYEDEVLKQMQEKVEALSLDAMRLRFAKIENRNSKIYIDPLLFNIPLAIGDRSETVQDLPSALMGTRFPVEGNKVRLFMQWGEGLAAQHLDMDLSCMLAYEDGTTDFCSYYQLSIPTCQHSGDIQRIPNKVGAAEYIALDMETLTQTGVKYVSFSCNAYTPGSLSPNLVVGWMDSQYPMKISEKTGVAYDPSCVQHQVRVTQGASKGLVFGVLDVQQREIIWLELSFDSQIVNHLDVRGVESLLAKLNSKLSIGHLLQIKAASQALEQVEHQGEAEEVYDTRWAMNTAAVTQLFLD